MISWNESSHDGKCSTLAVMNSSNGVDYINPKELSNNLNIVLKTSVRTMKSTMSQLICSVGLLTRRFTTVKANFRYKQLAKVFGSFYAYYLKSETESLWGYVGGVVYTNKLHSISLFLVRTRLVKITAGL